MASIYDETQELFRASFRALAAAEGTLLLGPAYADARITRIYGGTSEIMKTIVAKDVLG